MKIAIVGAGNMGQALAAGLLTCAVVTPSELLLIDTDQQTRINAANRFGCPVAGNLRLSEMNPDCLVLATKPTDVSLACQALPALANSCLVISVMAGVSIDTLRQLLKGHQLIVRCMPNLGAAIGKSITPYLLAGENLPGDQTKQITERIETILGVLGDCMLVNTEKLIDAATALSGSGPAYFFYVVEAITAAGQKLGFSVEESLQLTLATLSASSSILDISRIGAEAERKRVTSPGGTTEAALKVFEQNNLKAVIDQAIQAAFLRAREISTGK